MVVEKRTPKQAHVNDAGGINIDHAGRGFLDDGREAGAQFGIAVDGRGFNLDCRCDFPGPGGEQKQAGNDQCTRETGKKSSQ